MFDLLKGGLQNLFGTTTIHCGRWSKMVEIKLPQIASGEIMLEQILLISVLEWTVNHDYWKICGMKGFDAGEIYL